MGFGIGRHLRTIGKVGWRLNAHLPQRGSVEPWTGMEERVPAVARTKSIFCVLIMLIMMGKLIERKWVPQVA